MMSMPDPNQTTEPESAALAAALPGELLSALVHWYRAYHHGPSSEHERLTEEQLAAAIAPHIDAMKTRLAAQTDPNQTTSDEAAALMRHIGMSSAQGCVADGGDHWVVMVYARWRSTSKPQSWKGRRIEWMENIGRFAP